jgi:eukaryotic-like serine/threonine-protein kinase
MVGDQSRLTWYDRTGRLLGSFRESGDYQHPWLSPDEKQIVVEKTDPTTGRHTIWTLDVAREVTSRLLYDATGAHQPLSSPDGKHLVFSSNRLGGVDLYSVRADGTGDQTVLLSSPERLTYVPSDWSLDQRLLLYFARGDLWILPLNPTGTPQPFLRTNANEIQGRFSPDLRWIAYTSDESGVPEVYVRRYPGGENLWRVSTNGGAQPQWRRDGKEIFYLAADGKLMAADVRVSASGFATDPARPLFDTGIKGLFVDRRNHYVVTRDGQRFLLNVTAEDDNLAPITVVMNWTAGIER